MSDDIKELVKRLRHYYRDLTSHGAEGDLVGDDVILSAADALEALVAENTRLKELYRSIYIVNEVNGRTNTDD